MPLHELKTDKEMFDRTWTGYKPWEFRVNDRNFQPGDDIILRETRFTGAEMAQGSPLVYTGREIRASIVMIPIAAPMYGLPDGFVIMTVSVNKRLMPDPDHEGKLIEV